jgi:hypothetical protein
MQHTMTTTDQSPIATTRSAHDDGEDNKMASSREAVMMKMFDTMMDHMLRLERQVESLTKHSICSSMPVLHDVWYDSYDDSTYKCSPLRLHGSLIDPVIDTVVELNGNTSFWTGLMTFVVMKTRFQWKMMKLIVEACSRGGEKGEKARELESILHAAFPDADWDKIDKCFDKHRNITSLWGGSPPVVFCEDFGVYGAHKDFDMVAAFINEVACRKFGLSRAMWDPLRHLVRVQVTNMYNTLQDVVSPSVRACTWLCGESPEVAIVYQMDNDFGRTESILFGRYCDGSVQKYDRAFVRAPSASLVHRLLNLKPTD